MKLVKELASQYSKGKFWVPLRGYPSSSSPNITLYGPLQPLYQPYTGRLQQYIPWEAPDRWYLLTEACHIFHTWMGGFWRGRQPRFEASIPGIRSNCFEKPCPKDPKPKLDIFRKLGGGEAQKTPKTRVFFQAKQGASFGLQVLDKYKFRTVLSEGFFVFWCGGWIWPLQSSSPMKWTDSDQLVVFVPHWASLGCSSRFPIGFRMTSYTQLVNFCEFKSLFWEYFFFSRVVGFYFMSLTAYPPEMNQCPLKGTLNFQPSFSTTMLLLGEVHTFTFPYDQYMVYLSYLYVYHKKSTIHGSVNIPETSHGSVMGSMGVLPLAICPKTTHTGRRGGSFALRGLCYSSAGVENFLGGAGVRIELWKCVVNLHCFPIGMVINIIITGQMLLMQLIIVKACAWHVPIDYWQSPIVLLTFGKECEFRCWVHTKWGLSKLLVAGYM